MAHVATITIDSAQVPSDLVDFPVYVDLADMPAGFWSTVADGGGDVRCFKSDGSTELPREVVSCDTSSEIGEMHIGYSGTLSSSDDTEIQLHADGTSEDYAPSATYGAEKVWTNDFAAVYHAQTGPSGGSLPDATANNHDGTFNNLPTSSVVAGQLGNASAGDGNGYIDLGIIDEIANNQHASISAWVRRVNGEATFNASNDGRRRFQVELSSSTLYVEIEDGSYSYPNTSNNNTGWQHIVLAHDGSKSGLNRAAVYVNATQQTLSSGGSEPAYTLPDSNAITNAWIHADADNGSRFGEVDEFRISTTTRSADWVSAEYANQSNPNTFYTVSGVQTSEPITMAATAAAQAAADAQVVRQALMQAQADGVAAAQAGLQALRQLTAQADANATAQATLRAARALSASAVAASGAEASLEAGAQLQATAGSASDAEATLRVQRNLQAAADALAGGEATLQQQSAILLVATAPATSGAEAEPTIRRLMQAESAADSEALASAAIDRLLASTAAAQARAEARLQVGTPEPPPADRIVRVRAEQRIIRVPHEQRVFAA